MSFPKVCFKCSRMILTAVDCIQSDDGQTAVESGARVYHQKCFNTPSVWRPGLAVPKTRVESDVVQETGKPTVIAPEVAQSVVPTNPNNVFKARVNLLKQRAASNSGPVPETPVPDALQYDTTGLEHEK